MTAQTSDEAWRYGTNSTPPPLQVVIEEGFGRVRVRRMRPCVYVSAHTRCDVDACTVAATTELGEHGCADG